MSSADRPSRAPRDGGFTLLEVVLAFAVLAIAMSVFTVVSDQSFRSGARALEMRDIRGMADTVFRRIVYEYWKWNDGDTGTADQWYAEFAEIRGSERDQWKVYRLVLHKKKGLVAGTDPSGRYDSLFADTDFYDRNRYGESRTRRTSDTTTGSTGTSGTSGTSGDAGGADSAASAGEPAYLVELDVYLEGTDEPVASLRSIVPLTDSEREEEAAR